MTASTPHASRSSARAPRQRGLGELIVDVLLVVGVAYYLWVAHSYPPDGREIPMVVGTVTLIAAIVQLIGWFVPFMWNLTHGTSATDRSERRSTAKAAVTPVAGQAVTDTAVATAAAETTAANAALADPGTPDASAPPTDTAAARARNADVPIAMAWAAGFVAAILVLGYDIAVPLFFLAYFGVRRQWKLALASAVVMWLVTHFLFETVLGIALPAGIFS